MTYSCNLHDFNQGTPLFPASGEMRRFVMVLSEHGVSGNEVATAAQLTLAELFHPTRLVSLEQVLALHRFAQDHISPGRLEIEVGQRQRFTSHGIVGLAIMNSPTLGAALTLTNRFWPLVNSKVELHRIRHADRLRIVLKPRMELPEDMNAATMALEMVKLIVLLRDLLGTDFSPFALSVDARDRYPPEPDVFERFMGCDVQHGIGTWLELPVALLDRPLRQAHAQTYEASVEECVRAMDALRTEPSLIHRIREQFGNIEYGPPSLAEIARRLCLSERTLRRRLCELGTSYREILEEVRFNQAKIYLEEDGITMDVIAERLGYTETANFRHAFKRWAGKSPRAFVPRVRINHRPQHCGFAVGADTTALG